MTWIVASFALLGLALVAGVAWYERSRPSSRVLALVGTLAALAALGRIAFAPLPNVKPTTDIVLIAGYALGGAPGFMIGAVAGLTSNFFFGQGPWTPWEMAAWGAVGVGGAALARMTGRCIGRVPLAIACALAGLAFGALMDFSDWTLYSGDHSWRWFAARSGTSLPFNLAHATGNLLFALAFGPALARSLERFRRRLDVRWVASAPAGATLLAVLAGLALLAGSPPAARAASLAAYLSHAQNRDGGFGDRPGLGSSSLFSAWATLGLAAQGRNPADASRGGRSALDYLRAGARGLSGAGDLERTLLVVGPAGVSARSFGGRDLIGALLSHRRSDGSFDGQVNLTAFAVLGLRSGGVGSGSSPVRAAGAWLARQADHDGGWNFYRGGGVSDIDDTGGVLQALVASGQGGSPAVGRAVAFLVHRQNPDGGFPANPGGGSNAQSTAWAVQGLVATGHDPEGLHRGGARSPLAYLRSLTAGDGSVRYSRTSSQDPVWVTGQAALALARRPFPLGRVARRGGRARAAAAGSAAGGGAPGSSSGGTAGSAGGSGGSGGGNGALAAGGIPNWSHLLTTSALTWAAGAGRLTALLLPPAQGSPGKR